LSHHAAGLPKPFPNAIQSNFLPGFKIRLAGLGSHQSCGKEFLNLLIISLGD
jgi:hypothetical protein